MVDTPKEVNGDETVEDDPSKKQPKHRRQRRRSKSRHSKSSDTGTRDNNTPDSADNDNNPLQHDLEREGEQASPPEQAADGETEEDNNMPLSEDEVSLSDKELIVPKDPVEQDRFKRRLIATENSLKKKQQQLQVDQDLLANRWTKVLAAEAYEIERPSKSYPKRRLLPHLEEEALKPTSPVYDVADQPSRGRAREAFQPEV